MLDQITTILLIMNAMSLGAIVGDWRNRWKDAKLLKDGTERTANAANEFVKHFNDLAAQVKLLTDKVNAHELSLNMKK
jgi:hypothetical protein